VTNVYNKTVIVNDTHVAFNGPGGIQARPTPQEEAYAHESHTAALASQTEHEHSASQNRQLFASENHGRPAIAATGRPGDFSGHNVVATRAAGGAYREPKMSPQEARGTGGNRNEAAHNEASRNESGRNAAHTDRPATRPESNEGRNNEAHNNQTRNNEAHNSQARNNEARNEAGNHGQKASHENTKPAKQQKAQKPAKQEKSEPKHNGHER